MKLHSIRRGLAAGIAGAALLAAFGVAQADHYWGNYHWARTSNPFTLKLGDNVTAAWDPYLAEASADWTASSVLNTTIVAGASNPKNCRPTAGRAEVCNAKYGSNGWLGIAQIWASGSHITQGVVKLNDTYYSSPTYNTPAWRDLVMCQEIGHLFGLGHQDENFSNANLNTCMDYTNSPESNRAPNQHDYDLLAAIYSHTDSSTTVAATTLSGRGAADVAPETNAEFGVAIGRQADGRANLFVKDLGGGRKVFTHVFWIPGSARGENAPHDDGH